MDKRKTDKEESREREGYKCENGLERVIHGKENEVICSVPKRWCEIRGNYWRCYLEGYSKCQIYLNYRLKHRR